MLCLFYLTNQLFYNHFIYIVKFLDPIDNFNNLQAEKNGNKGYQYYRTYPYHLANLAIYPTYNKPSMASLIIVPDNFVGYARHCWNNFRVGLTGKLTPWNFHGVENGNVSVSKNPICPTNERVCLY